MKKVRVAWMVAAVITMNGFAIAPAQAMTILHCYLYLDHSKCDAHGPPGGGDNGSQPVNVPEPGTLMLLATGIGAAGVAAWKRRRKKD